MFRPLIIPTINVQLADQPKFPAPSDLRPDEKSGITSQAQRICWLSNARFISVADMKD
jgi:hypothetical protein